MGRKIPDRLRQSVAQRANHRCEYCRLREEDSYDCFHVDHILPQKHGGIAEIDNLAYAYPDCNLYKGTDIGTYLDKRLTFTRLFNPRTDSWFDHFEVFEGVLSAKTDVGKATIRIFRLDEPDRVALRQVLYSYRRYP